MDYAAAYEKAVRYSAADRDAFLNALRDHPTDTTPRKVFADYLDEHPEEAAPGVSDILRYHEGPLVDHVNNRHLRVGYHWSNPSAVAVRLGDDGRVHADFTKTVHPGIVNRRALVVHIEYEDGRLSLIGRHGRGSYGQIDMGFAHRDPKHDDRRYGSPTKPSEIKFARGWDRDKWLDLLDAWLRYNMNATKSGTKKQQDYLYENPVHIVYPQSHYDLARRALAEAGLDPDPETGDLYGHKRHFHEVPPEVLSFLVRLPDTDRRA